MKVLRSAIGGPVTTSEPLAAVSREGAIAVLTLNRPPHKQLQYGIYLQFVGALTASRDVLAQVYASSRCDEWLWIEMTALPGAVVVRARELV